MEESNYETLKEFIKIIAGYLDYHNLLKEYKGIMPFLGTSRPSVIAHFSDTTAKPLYLRKYPFIYTLDDDSDLIESPEDLDATLTALEDYVAHECIRLIDEERGGVEHPELIKILVSELGDENTFGRHVPDTILTFTRNKNKENMELLCGLMRDIPIVDTKNFACRVSEKLRPFLAGRRYNFQSTKPTSNLPASLFVVSIVVLAFIHWLA